MPHDAAAQHSQPAKQLHKNTNSIYNGRKNIFTDQVPLIWYQ